VNFSSLVAALGRFRRALSHIKRAADARPGRLPVFLLAVLVWLAGAGTSLQGLKLARAAERRAFLEATLRRDRNASARQRAALALGQLADTEALSSLVICLLGDREASVRAACADALGALAEPSAQPALRAAAKDESPLVRKQASAALAKLSGDSGDPDKAPLKSRVTIVVGRMGAKAKSGTMPDIPARLREAVIKELRGTRELDTIEELRDAGDVRSGYSVDSSVTRLSRRTTPAGELEISCDVSMIIAVLPQKAVVGMVSGGASVIGPRGPSTKPTKAFLENLESEALSQAAHEAHSSFMTFLRQQQRAGR
jgi:hypothetical protein